MTTADALVDFRLQNSTDDDSHPTKSKDKAKPKYKLKDREGQGGLRREEGQQVFKAIFGE